jgi:carboxypeptidase Q
MTIIKKGIGGVALAVALVLPSIASAQGDPAVVARIVDEGKNRNQVMNHMTHLTKRIGPRLTGSPGLERGQQWAMSQFRSFGLTNVHLDKWGDIPVGFERGPRQIARMVAPYQVPMEFTTSNWTPGTKGLTRGHAVYAPRTMEDFAQVEKRLKGAWLIMPTQAGMRGAESRESEELRTALNAAGIHGRVHGARDERIHSSGTWRGKTYENRPTDVVVIVRKSDMDRIVRNLDWEREVVLEFDIENRWIRGPIPQYNVVADIVGTEKPDEIVIVSGHYDSWNSPGSEGASDNGTGSMVAMEAARILMAAGAKPKRTIRFILWSGEEQGLLGSRAYVEKHKDLLDKISAMLNDDGGSNYQGGYTGIASQKEMMERAFAPTVEAFPNKPMRFVTVPQMPQGGSSDHAPFNWEGVPGFFTIETGRQNYGHVWHTQYDTLENTIPEYLVQSATNHAVVSYNLAMADTLLPRGPKPDRRTPNLAEIVEAAVGADRVYFPHYHTTECDHTDDYWLYHLDRMQWMMKYLTRSLVR